MHQRNQRSPFSRGEHLSFDHVRGDLNLCNELLMGLPAEIFLSSEHFLTEAAFLTLSVLEYTPRNTFKDGIRGVHSMNVFLAPSRSQKVCRRYLL